MSVFVEIAIGIVFGFLFTLCSLRLLAVLQQEHYAGGAFLKWYFRLRNVERKKASVLSLAFALLSALFCVCFSFLEGAVPELTLALALLPYVGLTAAYVVCERRYALKVPAVRTARYMRLAVLYAVVMMALCVGLVFGLAALAGLIVWADESLARHMLQCFVVAVPPAVFPMVAPLVLAFVNLVIKAYEIPHTNRFVRRAKAALAASPCIKVGITGSFGKTSVKHFAAVLLAKKYRVFATPASYNTPVGIAKAVNERGLDCDIFLAEMGARRTGDIAALCDMVSPSVGVVTGVSCQHLQTFGTPEAIVREKSVLAARVKTCVLGRSAADMPTEHALAMGRDFDAEQVELSPEGTRFLLRLPEGELPVCVPVLGRHAAEDIAMAAMLCAALGMTLPEIAAGIADIAPVPHRLQRIDADGLTVLDDAYNCNVEGARCAVEVLKLAPGKKAVVTPGIVELGQLEQEENGALGASFAGLDLVVLVGETLVLDVRAGYLAAGGDEKNVRVVPTLAAAQRVLAEELPAGACVLFLNDLPDCYR